jgi:opacity protein-like surface antigen
LKKIHFFMCVALLVGVMILLPGVSHSAMWVGGELGANFIGSSDVNLRFNPGVTETFKDASVESSVIGGATIGYDFVKEGLAGYNWPDWMKYFSFAVDFTYNRMDRRRQYLSVSPSSLGDQSGKDTLAHINGSMAVLTFLFMGHYGLWPDAKVPTGRLQPYLGIGPGLVFSSKEVGDYGSASSTDIALVVESGIRFFALKNVSLDAAFRYRWFSPKYEFTGAGLPVDVDFDANNYSVLVRANYHF